MVAGDDLETPLGLKDRTGKAGRRLFGLPLKIPPLGMLIAVLLVLCLAGFVGWAVVVDDPLGGEPAVVVSVEPEPPAARSPGASPEGAGLAETDPSHAAAPAKAAASGKMAAAGRTITIIDGTSGKRREISLPSGAGTHAAKIDQRLLEETRHGPVPRTGLDGSRPSLAYARPADSSKPAAPRIALIMSGLGISARNTAEAIKTLPAAVTLAFAPYGADLERIVAGARGKGHEVLLQVPMEPFDYPENDPGPQTLLTSLAPEQNIDRMHWLMSRFKGYVGLVNAMGARFTATETALAPVLRETAKRGLVYLDDGSSPRSLASQIAGANNMPFAKADVVIDAVPALDEVKRALSRLETIARRKGAAVGITSALPLSIKRIAQWAETVEARGFVLVPVTAVAAKAKES